MDDDRGTARAERADERRQMVERQLRRRDVGDERVLRAMTRVPRHAFVPATVAARAYDDRPLPIGHDVTISQPYVVALMAQALRVQPTDRALEVGTGSGYGAAVLAELAAHVTTIETIAAHASAARDRLERLVRADRIAVVHGDGAAGHPPGAPYDVISVTAAAPEIPAALLDQLAPGGRLVMPVGDGPEELTLVERTHDGDVRRSLGGVRFVPLT